MEKKTPWWHYLLLMFGVAGSIGSWGDYTLEGRVAQMLSIILVLTFGVILPIIKK